jgi:hypothetical protein
MAKPASPGFPRIWGTWGGQASPLLLPRGPSLLTHALPRHPRTHSDRGWTPLPRPDPGPQDPPLAPRPRPPPRLQMVAPCARLTGPQTPPGSSRQSLAPSLPAAAPETRTALPGRRALSRLELGPDRGLGRRGAAGGPAGASLTVKESCGPQVRKPQRGRRDGREEPDPLGAPHASP